MPPSLYAASAFVGKPTKIDGPVLSAKKKGKQRVDSAPSTVDEPSFSDPKPKRQLSEEQKQKMKAARELKKQEKLAAAEAERKAHEEAAAAEADAAAALQAKKEAAAAKRREARLKRKAEAETDTSASGSQSGDSNVSAPAAEEEEPAPKPKKQRVAKKPKTESVTNADTQTHEKPPQWFEQFVSTIMVEKNEQQGTKTSKKQLQEQAKQTAEAKWQDGYTRERVRNAVDSHIANIYSQIFR